MSVLPCGIIHFSLIPISQMKLCLNKQRLRLSEAVPTRLPLWADPTAGHSRTQGVLEQENHPPHFLGSLVNRLFWVFSVCFWKIRSQKRKWGNEPALTEGLCIWLWGQQCLNSWKNQSRESYKWWGLREKAFFLHLAEYCKFGELTKWPSGIFM